jgi:tubulin--tyrosine ligase-like protein 12
MPCALFSSCALFVTHLCQAACKNAAPEGIGHNPQSRALYAVDLMLVAGPDGPEPRLLEMNFQPDTLRACKYHPNFYNDCFSLLFLGQEEGLPVTRL